MLIGDYKKAVEAATLKDVKITVTGSSACINFDTSDPIGRAMLENLGTAECLETYVASVYVEGHK